MPPSVLGIETLPRLHVTCITLPNSQVMDIPKDEEADYQTTVTVSCTVNACPTAQWTWTKDGQLINFDGSRTIDRGSSIEVSSFTTLSNGFLILLTGFYFWFTRKLIYSQVGSW